MPNSNTTPSTYTSMMRVTSSGRPYAKDMFDLWSAFLIQIPLTDHRSFFRTYSSTFTTEEAIKVFSDLKFTHVVRTADPNDPTRHVATRTTTTFSMSPNMVKTLGTYMVNARLAEDAVNPQNRTMKDKGIWRPTPKGKFLAQEFAQRAYVSMSHKQDQLARIGNFKIFALERLRVDDRLSFSRVNLTNAFKTMMAWLPTERLIADDHATNIKRRNVNDFQHTFYGYQCFEWLCEYTTTASPEEAQAVAAEFVLYGWICEITDKPELPSDDPDAPPSFRMTQSTLYYVTERGQKVLEWNTASMDEKASSVASSSDQSLSDKSELVQMQQTHANRLLPTEKHANPSGVVKVTIAENKENEQKQQQQQQQQQQPSQSASSSTQASSGVNTNNSNAPLVINAQDRKYDFGFKTDSVSDESVGNQSETNEDEELDETTRKLLRLRAKGGGSDDGSISSKSNDNEHQEQEDHLSLGVYNQPKDTQWIRLGQLLQNRLLRIYFREYLKSTFCEENINYWVDYQALRKRNREGANKKELGIECYRIYDRFLAPTAEEEVNIDHALHQEITHLVKHNFKVSAGPATTDLPFSSGAVQQIASATKVHVVHEEVTLVKLLHLYGRVNDHVCRTMAQDSVPRFAKTQRYRDLLAEGKIQE
ncbi:hypothetical protein K492DRAFT_236163 [Lichtheimia hyalospora FSU 10163]|nr:hypothetical protein K492DRAFT_236163 [Lichtheimia hyalospora FSU 10163]